MVAGVTNNWATNRAAARPARQGLDDLKRAITPRIAEAVVTAELGKPSQRYKTELRWRNRHSFALYLTGPKGIRYQCYETGEGGDLLHFIARTQGVSIGKAIRILREYLGGHTPSAPVNAAPTKAASKTADPERNTAIVLRIWREAQPILGTLAEIYLAVVRGLDVARLDSVHALRWHARAQAGS